MAENQRRFRLANERIDEARREFEFDGETVPFLCECPDPGCTAVVPVPPEEYGSLREVPNRWLLLPDHVPAGERVLEERDGYVITSKEAAA